MQPTVEMIKDNYTTRQLYNIKKYEHELYYCHRHSLKTYTCTHTHTYTV